MRPPTKTTIHGKPALDFGTRTVPDDQYNDLDIGKGWRKHWTILCPSCHTPSPYVMDLRDGREVNPLAYHHYPDDYVVDLWDLKCPACGTRWISEDEYYES